MRKHLLLGLMISLCAMSAWAADVSLTEKFSTQGNTISGQPVGTYDGDICKWAVKANRRSQDVITIDATTSMQCWWLTKGSNGYVKSKNFEGGFKKVSFRAAKFGAANTEANNTLILSVSVGNELAVQRCTIPQDLVKENGGQDFEFSFEPTSGQLEINNISSKGGSDDCRILVGDITITPYILYRPHCKFIKLGLKQKGFKNYLIDNTGGGTITYSSGNTSIATVDANGVVTPVAAGTTTISASWNGYSTTYSLTIIDREDDVIVENFSKIDPAEKQISSRTFWEGDLYQWAVRYVRRNWGDTLVNESPRQLGTFFPRTAYIETNENIEGGVKHLRFEARQWGASTNNILVKAYYYYSSDWQLANTYEKTPSSGQEYVFDKDINDGANGNSKLKISNESTTGDKEARIVIPNLQITPWLLYTTKEATLNMRVVSDDPTRTFINSNLINNTEATPTYTITDYGGIPTDKIEVNASGQVSVADRFQTGDITVQAAWSNVATTYTLHVQGKTETTASFAAEKVYKDVNDPAFDYPATIFPAGALSVTYSSSNGNVATVNNSGYVTIVGVGQTQIIAIVSENANYGGARDTFNLYVRDNSAQIETFKGRTTENVVVNSEDEWAGDLFDWKVLQVRRYPGTDTLWSNPSEQGTWIRTHNTSANYIQSKDVVEGGIKYLTFYWKQIAAENDRTLRLAVFAGGTRVASMEREPDDKDQSYCCHEKFLFGANDVMQSNQRLTIKNESYTDTDNDGEFDEDEITKDKNSRIVIGNIHITPYLLYTNKNCTLDMRVESAEPTRTFTNNELKNNTTGGTIEYSIVESSIGVGITPDGEISATNRFQTGDVTIQAKWVKDEVDLATTTYTLHVLGKTETTASYDPTPKKIGLNGDPTKEITKTAGYDETITYSSSRPDVVQVVNNELKVVGVGVTTITATLPETSLFSGTSASYVLYVRDEEAAIKEHFKNVKTGTGSIAKKDTVWTGVAFDWKPQGTIRHNVSDTIWGTDADHRSVWIATGAQETEGVGVLGSKYPIEGGIKHLSFYWKQWGHEENKTLRLAVFDNSTRKEYMEKPSMTPNTYEKYLFGANDVMRGNDTLYIKNESFTGALFDPANITTSDSRMIIDTIFITPWLKYMDKAHTMRVGDADYKHPIVNNTGGTVTYSLIPSDSEVASISPDGTVSALKPGVVIVQATWEEGGVSTFYHLTVKPQETASLRTETFPNATGSYYASSEEHATGDHGTWYTLNGGINVNDVIFATNAAHLRAPFKVNNAKAAYVKNTLSRGINTLAFDWNLVGLEDEVDSFKIIIFVNDIAIDSITNASHGMLYKARNRFSSARSFAISDLQVHGNFELKIENRSTIKGGVSYESGQKARFIIDNIEWEPYIINVTLENDDSNVTVIGDNNGKEADVQLADRTIRTGGYNTLCLPFAVSEEKLKAVLGEGVKAYEFTNAYLNATNLDIRFNKVTALGAGKPYLVTVPADVTNPVFESVTIDNSDETKDKNITVGENMRFIGTYNPMRMNETGLYVVANNLYRVSNISEPNVANKTIGACRAYFDVLEGAPALAPGVRMRIVAGENTATDIEEVRSEDVNTVRSEKILIDGQLIIIREGKMYNAQGQIIR